MNFIFLKLINVLWEFLKTNPTYFISQFFGLFALDSTHCTVGPLFSGV
jgi:hypothetical protein